MEVELRNFAKKKLSTILHNVVKSWDSRWNQVTDMESVDEFSGEIIGRLWEKVLIYFRGFHAATEPCSAEEAVAEIIRKGLKKEYVEVDEGNFILTLPNYTYVVKKIERKFLACPQYARFSYQDYSSKWISLNKDAFAEFIFEFDAIMPFVKGRIDAVLTSLMPQIQHQCKVANEFSLLSKKYLKPWLHCKIDGFRDGWPELVICQEGVLPISKHIDPNELKEFIRTVPSLMKKRPMVSKYYYFMSRTGTLTACLDWNSLAKKDRMDLIDYFINDTSHTHSRISGLNRGFTEDGMLRIWFDFNAFDWVHMLWNIEQCFPKLKAWYMVVQDEIFAVICKAGTLVTNDAEGRYFLVEDRKVQIIKDLHEIREDCEVDKTGEMRRHLWGGLEMLDGEEDDDRIILW